MGVADFFVSSKYDLPMRQMSWLRRFFWRCVHRQTKLPRILKQAGLGRGWLERVRPLLLMWGHCLLVTVQGHL
jgi:hypothetical protein